MNKSRFSTEQIVSVLKQADIVWIGFESGL